MRIKIDISQLDTWGDTIQGEFHNNTIIRHPVYKGFFFQYNFQDYTETLV